MNSISENTGLASKSHTIKTSSTAHWSFRLALAGLTLMILVVFGHRLAIIDFKLAMIGLVIGALLGLLAIFMSAAGVIATHKTEMSGKVFAWFGMALGVITILPVVTTMYAASKVPPIHDISTDLLDPPEFKAILAVRTNNHNSLSRQNPNNLATLQQTAYQGLTSIFINQPSNQVFNQALELVNTRGWEIVATSRFNGRIEATATTPMMGFKDDIVIRIRDEMGHTVVDMRSVSRVGKSDLGTNAARITAFLADLQR